MYYYNQHYISIVLLVWFHFFSSKNGVSLEIFSFYLIGSIQYFLISYFLSYFFKSPMGSLAILLLFSYFGTTIHRKSSGTID